MTQLLQATRARRVQDDAPIIAHDTVAGAAALRPRRLPAPATRDAELRKAILAELTALSRR